MNTKICRDCGIEKLESEFSLRRGKATTWCRPCKAIYDRRFYTKDPERIRRKKEVLKLWQTKSRQFVYDYLKSHPCIDCGESDPIVLGFDHLGDKEFTIGAKTREKSIASLIKEIKKCEVRCSNCHDKKTAKQFNWYAGLITN